ncbi:hypothetical protein ZWY2020_016306 [Hordeum vulgare]|nr:hypothetical protein ZWY2020_016306 [Hordeum vulgare]
MEILLLIGCPTTLVCAALVCKQWFCHASDPAFLCRFSKLHPPCLLGFYVNTRIDLSRFVPMLPQPAEFDAVIRRASSSLDKYKECQDGYFHTFSRLLFKEEGDGFSYVYLDIESDGTKSTMHVYMLQDGVWCVHASATTQLPCLPLKLNPLIVDNKIYMAATLSEILVLDFTALSFSTFQLPQGLVIGDHGTMLSRADDDSGVYLIHLKEPQLCIWLRTRDNWLLVDTICLHEMYAKLGMSDVRGCVWINQVGGNAEFVFLQMGRCLVYAGINCRKLCKVYELTSEDQWFGPIQPCMTIWPPTFPALKDDPARFVFWPFGDFIIPCFCVIAL